MPLTALAVVFALEAVGLAAVLVLLIVQIALASGHHLDVGASLAIVVLTAFGVAALALLSVGALRARSWIRSAGIVWQLVQLFIGLAAFQGAGAQPVLGALIVVPALVGLALLFTPAVRIALRRPERPDPEPPPPPAPRKRR